MWKEGMKERKEGGSVKQKGEKSDHDIIQVYIYICIYIVGVCCRECLPATQLLQELAPVLDEYLPESI